MKKKFFGSILFLFGLVLSLHANTPGDYPYESPYDGMFCSLTDVSVITNALEEKDADLVFSSLKRVGQLKLSCAKEKVRMLILNASPSRNCANAKASAELRHICYEGILVLGKIGNAEDGKLLSDYLQKSSDVTESVCLLKSISTTLKGSDTAPVTLASYVRSFSTSPDNRITRQLVDTILQFHSRSFLTALLTLEHKVTGEMKDYVSAAIKELCDGSAAN